MITFFAGHDPVEITIETSGAFHYWAQLLKSFGDAVKRESKTATAYFARDAK
jgi:hypothetical protein